MMSVLWCLIKPGLPEGRSDHGGRAVELGGGYISLALLCKIQVLIIFDKVDGVYLYNLYFVIW